MSSRNSSSTCFSLIASTGSQFHALLLVLADASRIAHTSIVGGISSATVTHTDVHPEFPSLRIPSAVIYKLREIVLFIGTRFSNLNTSVHTPA
jgi:hypothetical protein